MYLFSSPFPSFSVLVSVLVGPSLLKTPVVVDERAVGDPVAVLLPPAGPGGLGGLQGGELLHGVHEGAAGHLGAVLQPVVAPYPPPRRLLPVLLLLVPGQGLPGAELRVAEFAALWSLQVGALSAMPALLPPFLHLA